MNLPENIEFGVSWPKKEKKTLRIVFLLQTRCIMTTAHIVCENSSLKWDFLSKICSRSRATYGTCATLGTPSNFQWHAGAPSFPYHFCYDLHRRYIDLDLYKKTHVVGTVNVLKPRVSTQLAKGCWPLICSQFLAIFTTFLCQGYCKRTNHSCKLSLLMVKKWL